VTFAFVLDEKSIRSENSRFQVDILDIQETWLDMGTFITSKLNDIDDDKKVEIASDFARAVLKLCEDVEAIAPERDSNNNAAQDLPGVLPNEIVKQRPRAVHALIQKQ
jgi:hypothetical protein